MKVAYAVLLLLFVQPCHVRTSATGHLVPVYADLRMNDLAYLLTTVLQGVDGACGARFVWRGRHEFMNNATAHAGPVILATTDEPSAEESAYISSVSDTQQILVLHLADELLRTTDPHIWGPGVQQVFRQYWAPHLGLGDAAISYLTDAGVKRPPAVAWMPLGIARLRPLSSAFSLALLDRTHLWSWIGSTEGKPERIEMLEALDAHSRAADIKAMGFLRPFQYFAGGWGTGGAVALGGPDAMGALEYTLLMHQTQFVPAPAGNSPEQFRIWEAFEAGCLPILLARHMEADGVLYPLKVLGFEVVALQSWLELPELLLQLAQELADNPGVYAQKQRHNTRLWAHVRGALGNAITWHVCEARSRAPYVR